MNNLKPSSFEEFKRETKRGNVVPVVRTVPADLRTPVDIFQAIATESPYSFLFESVEGGENVARYTFLGFNPEMVVHARGNQTIIERSGARETLEIRAPDYLREHFRSRTLANRDDLAPLAGGAVGFLGYGAARWFEPALDRHHTNVSGEDEEAAWMFCRTVLAFDRARQTVDIVSVVFADDAENEVHLRSLYERAVTETSSIVRALQQSTGVSEELSERRKIAQAGIKQRQAHWSQAGFERAVESAKEYIAAGDAYQVVLSQRFTQSVTASPLSVYRALRASNPSPYMFFLRLGENTIIGASPEMLVRCRGRELEYRPIAGTRPRGANELEDVRLGEEMRGDEKEVAEHVMLVDLGRNDLGRVAEYGSVRVDKLMSIERYSHVQHLVSSLRARLREGLDRFDALAACFPAGTVTGAPKVRAMEIIRELEPEPRGVYAGTVMYADYANNLDSCIAIRTLVLDADALASVQAGAGIVADSIPKREYEETLNKAAALFRAIEIAEEGSEN